MKKKLDCILLVDDDEPTNFLHKFVIHHAGVAETVAETRSGEEALSYLQSSTYINKSKEPNLIFLDINMPGMNGWEFLKEYKKISDPIKRKIVILMLTTSLNPDDKELANTIPEVSGFINKPLNTEILEKILKEHFPDHY